jgi:hypothetical protein
MTAIVMITGSNGTRGNSSQALIPNAAMTMKTMKPKPRPWAAVAEGTFRNQPREATWLRTDVCSRDARSPCFPR